MTEEQEREVMKLVERYGEECARVEYLSHTDSLRPMHELEKDMALEKVSEALASLAKPQPVGGADTLRDALVALLASYGRLKPNGYPKSDAEKQAEAALATLSAPVAPAPEVAQVQPEPAFITSMIDDRRKRYALDQSCTPAFLHWLDTMTPREGVGANEAWNAGVEWQAAQATQGAQTISRQYADAEVRDASGKLLAVVQAGEHQPRMLSALAATQGGAEPMAWRTSQAVKDRLCMAAQVPVSPRDFRNLGKPGNDVQRVVWLSDLQELLQHAGWAAAPSQAAAVEPAQAAPAAVVPEALERDAARLDYLQRRGATVEILSIGGGEWKFRIGGRYSSADISIRAAIDAAMNFDRLAAKPTGKEPSS